MLLAVLGILSIVLQFLSFIQYDIDILCRRTKPERAGFWIFALLDTVTLATQLTRGFSWSALLIAVSLLNALFVAFLSIKLGYGRFKKRDLISILIAVIGVVLWLITDEPIIAIIIVIAVDVAGFWLIVVKSWHKPQSETYVAWLLAGVSAVLAVIATGTLDLVVTGYVLYSAIANIGLALMLLYRKRRLGIKLF